MADKDYKAFIVEGEARENIYMLWKKLKADDFDTDIIEVLRESNKKIREQLDICNCK